MNWESLKQALIENKKNAAPKAVGSSSKKKNNLGIAQSSKAISKKQAVAKGKAHGKSDQKVQEFDWTSKGGYIYPDKVTKKLALDCEFVGVGIDGKGNALARVSIVNYEGEVVYDKYVCPEEQVVDYRTAVSGVTRSQLLHGDTFENVKKEVSELIRNRIVIGHAINNDFEVLKIFKHPKKLIRDTAKFVGFKSYFDDSFKSPSLKLLCKNVLSLDIQSGMHDSIKDAQHALLLYKSQERAFEKSINSRYK
uniref:RNA exonuclease 4 n=1 Tax=Rhabditophanes sp. KR3021 TaxID=114890 RepID=A0AC35UBI1_9BILA